MRHIPLALRRARRRAAAAPVPSAAKFPSSKANPHFHLPWQGRFAARPL